MLVGDGECVFTRMILRCWYRDPRQSESCNLSDYLPVSTRLYGAIKLLCLAGIPCSQRFNYKGHRVDLKLASLGMKISAAAVPVTSLYRL